MVYLIKSYQGSHINRVKKSVVRIFRARDQSSDNI